MLDGQATTLMPYGFAPNAVRTIKDASRTRASASGNVLAFVANGLGGRSGSRVLAHVMVSLGNGAAPDWSIADLAGMNRVDGLLVHDGRQFEVRMRHIETSEQPSCIVM